MTDRVCNGETLTVSCDLGSVESLREGYWEVELAQPDGTRNISAQLPVERLGALRAWLAEHDGCLL